MLISFEGINEKNVIPRERTRSHHKQDDDHFSLSLSNQSATDNGSIHCKKLRC